MSTNDGFIALAEDKNREAIRRAAHLTMLLAVDEDGAAFQREVHKLAVGDDADPVFAAQVAAFGAQLAAQVLVHTAPVETRRAMLMDLIADNAPSNLTPPEEPS